jgi:hypothetical protein
MQEHRVKPCPFCGSSAEVDWVEEEPRTWVITCMNLECAAKIIGANGLEAWNKRTPNNT